MLSLILCHFRYFVYHGMLVLTKVPHVWEERIGLFWLVVCVLLVMVCLLFLMVS